MELGKQPVMWDLLQFRLLAAEAENLCFFKHYDRTYKDLPGPCRTNVYKTMKSSNQTNTCAEMAARFYYNKLHPGEFLNDLEAMDSHTFDRRYYDAADDKAYFHVNFTAKTPSRASPSSIFFAELSGVHGPEEVNMCVQLDAGEMDNCIFCTGIWHPRDSFVGHMDPDTKRKILDFIANIQSQECGLSKGLVKGSNKSKSAW